MKKLSVSLLLLLIGSLSSFVSNSYSATVQVNVSGFSFSPNNVTINAGDTVQWVFLSGTHTTTSGTNCTSDGKWDSGFRSSGSFSQLFNVPGTYPYFCIPHCSFGMKGTVTVNAVPDTPALSVTPADDLGAAGSEGGPFTPSSKEYTVSNTGGGTLSWTVVADQNWVTVTPFNGTNAGTVTVSINSLANSLTGSAAGTSYIATVTFDGNGGSTTRSVNLSVSTPRVLGDINGDGLVSLKDAILALQVLSGLNPPEIVTNYATSGADVDGDSTIGLPEVIYILQKLAGIRQ